MMQYQMHVLVWGSLISVTCALNILSRRSTRRRPFRLASAGWWKYLASRRRRAISCICLLCPTERQHHAVGWKEASFGAHTDVQRRVYPGQFKGESFLCTPTNGDDDYRTDSNTSSAKMVIVDLPPCGHEARKRLKNRAGYIQKASTIDRSK